MMNESNFKESAVSWIINVEDVFSNHLDPLHLKVTKIEQNKDVVDSKIHYVMVDPNNHENVILEEEDWCRAWHINESWHKRYGGETNEQTKRS